MSHCPLMLFAGLLLPSYMTLSFFLSFVCRRRGFLLCPCVFLSFRRRHVIILIAVAVFVFIYDSVFCALLSSSYPVDAFVDSVCRFLSSVLFFVMLPRFLLHCLILCINCACLRSLRSFTIRSPGFFPIFALCQLLIVVCICLVLISTASGLTFCSVVALCCGRRSYSLFVQLCMLALTPVICLSLVRFLSHLCSLSVVDCCVCAFVLF